MFLVYKQWGRFNCNVPQNTMQNGTINFPISFSNFVIPLGILSGYNGLNTRTTFTLERTSLLKTDWVIYTNSAEINLYNNSWFAIGA